MAMSMRMVRLNSPIPTARHMIMAISYCQQPMAGAKRILMKKDRNT